MSTEVAVQRSSFRGQCSMVALSHGPLCESIAIEAIEAGSTLIRAAGTGVELKPTSPIASLLKP